ncbi:MAG: hypothetical protein Q4A74_02795 [Cardiobacteriaceae bacterium]|nr:hypothetical protein [Cardiobacteriaceae bacterium]
MKTIWIMTTCLLLLGACSATSSTSPSSMHDKHGKSTIGISGNSSGTTEVYGSIGASVQTTGK